MSRPTTIISRLNQLIVRSGLTTTQAIRMQLVVLLHFMRIEEIVCYHYERRFKILSKDERCTTTTTTTTTTHKGPRVAPFPRSMPKFFLRYQTFSTFFMILCLIKSTFPEQLNMLLMMLYDSRAPACMVPGRFIFHRVLRNQFVIVLSGFNLAYRFYVWYARKPYEFALIDALVQDDSELENFYQMLETKANPISGARIASHPFTQFMCYQVEVPIERSCYRVKKLKQNYGTKPQEVEGEDHSYRLRLNMSPEVCARHKLYIAYSFLFMLITMAWVSLVVGSGFALMIVLDWGYLYNYPNCNEHLEHLYASNQLPWYSMTLTPHRCIMIVFDVLENMVIYLDSGFTLFALFPLLIVLNNQVLCQWHLLHKRIVAAVQQLRAEHQLRVSSGIIMRKRGAGKGVAAFAAAAAATNQQRTLVELKAGMRDFFEQVSHLNVLASDVMSMSFLMWLIALLVIANRAFTYYLTHPDFFSLLGFSFPTVFLAGMPFAAAPTTMVSFILFGLNTHCVRTYNSLCALVAYQEPRSEKSRFSAEMMEYFVYQDRICYKILHTYPFKATSYFKIVSWAATSLALQINMINQS